MQITQTIPYLADTSSVDNFKQTHVKQTIDTFIVVDKAIDHILDKGTEKIYNRYLRKKIPSHYAEFFTNAYEDVITQEIRAYDPGESIDSYLINWADEEEPEVAPLDSWAPISVKIDQLAPESSKTHTAGSLNSIAESVKSQSLKLSLFHRKAAESSPKNAKKKGKKDEIKTTESDKEQPELHFYKVPGFDRYVDDDEQSNLLRKQREDIVKEKQSQIEEAKQKVIDDKQREEKKKNMERQVKNKEYTFDYDGNPVFLTRVVQVSKLPNKESVVPEFDLNAELKVVKCLPDDPPVREEKKEDDQNKKLNLSIVEKKGDGKKKKVEGDEYFLPIVGSFTQILEVRPGVKVEINSKIKEGPEIKNQEKMRRADFLKMLEERKKEKRDIYKRFKDGQDPDPILEDEEHPDAKMNRIIEEHLKKLGDLNKLTDVEIHEQQKFIQMLLDDVVADPKAAADEALKREKIIKKMQKLKEEQEEAQRANVIENRIVNYKKLIAPEPNQLPPLRNIAERPKTTKAQPKPNKIQKGFDAYNRQLLEENAWSQSKQSIVHPQTPKGKSPKLPPGVEKRSAIKMTVIDSHVGKEPRDRLTVAQKKAMESHPLSFLSPVSVKSDSIRQGLSMRIAGRDGSAGLGKIGTSKSGFLSPKVDEDNLLRKSGVNESVSQGKAKILVRNTRIQSDKSMASPSTVNQSVDTKVKR